MHIFVCFIASKHNQFQHNLYSLVLLQGLSLELTFSISLFLWLGSSNFSNVGCKSFLYIGHFDIKLWKLQKKTFSVKIEVCGKKVRFLNTSENTKEQAGAEMCQAHIKVPFGLAQFGEAWLGWALVWHGLV